MLRTLTFFTSFFSFIAMSMAQQLLVSDELGEPIIGAYVTIKDGPESIEKLITDQYGRAHISFTPPYTLYIQHLGFHQHSAIVDSNDDLSLILKEDHQLLDEVVVTGQHSAQSAKKSVYKVRTINSQRIEAQSVTSIEEVLRNELNFRFSRDNATGTSNLNMLGLSGQYVKVLIDGVPLEGRSGTANAIDLSQINVLSIDRIEIVEGPMSVNYGADALGGVINIITKKSSADKVSATVTLHEESVGNEYSWFSQGIHSPAVNLNYQVNDDYYIKLESRIRDFGGWKGDAEGRTHEWYPKRQYFQGAVLGVSRASFQAYYRLDWLNESLINQGLINDNNPRLDPFAIDEKYLTERWQHQIQTDWQWKKGGIQHAISYSDYSRNIYQYNKNFVTGQETQTVDSEQDTTRFKNFFIRSTANHRLSKSWSLQAGLEFEHENGAGTRLSAGDKGITDFSLFSTAELTFQQLKIRAGLRLNQNSQFETAPTPALNFQYTQGKNIWRLGYGRGYRAPSLRELYHEFIDTNHNILGNEDLKPEYSHALNADYERSFLTKNVTLNISGFYNYVDNMITFFTPSAANEPTTYTNLETFQSLGGNLRVQWTSKKFNVNSGFGYQGRYQVLSGDLDDVPSFLFSPEINTTVQYTLKGYQLSVFHKFVGKNRSYQLVIEGEQEVTELGEFDSYTMLDFTLSKIIKNTRLSAGVRNLTNLTGVNNSFSGGAHGGSEAQANIAYGRSYFLNLTYQFKHSKP